MEPLRPASSWRQFQQGRPQTGRHIPAELAVVVLADLKFNHDPLASQRLGAELAQEYGFADAPQPCDDHGLLGATVLHPGEEQVEGSQLVVPPDDGQRLRTRVRRVGVGERLPGRVYMV